MTVAWIAADWPVSDAVVAGTTERSGGVSKGEFESMNLASHVGDVPAAVARNRRRFQDDWALPSEPAWLTQVHGSHVVLSRPMSGQSEADGIVTRNANIVCAVLTADCLPVLFSAVDGTEIGAAHAGWRGLCAGILEETIAAMTTPPGQIMAWFGPAISQPAFEVGAEVRQQFVQRDKDAGQYFSENARGRWQADLYGLARMRLNQCGVTGLFGGDHCTHSEPERFFSYRRDGRCGRMASFIFLRRNT